MTYPKNWVTQSLKDWGMQAQSGFASGVHNAEGNGVIHLRPMNVTRLGKLDFTSVKSVEDDSTRRINKGDILFNNTNSAELVGKTAIVDVEGEFAFSNHMTRLRFPAEKVLHRYMSILLHSFWMSGYFNEICSNHVNQASVSIKRLEQVEVSLPPIDEQNKIVELLEDHLSRLDAALADVKQAKLKAAQFKVAFLRNVFSGDASWNSIPMKQLGKWGGGGTPSKANEKFWTDGTVPWLSPKDMGPLEITQTVDKITEEACLNSTVKKIPENSVVFVVRSGILERKLPIALTKVETTLNQDMKALTFSDKVNPKFGFYSMLGLEQDILRTCRKSGTTVASINTESLMNYEIKIPSLPVQAEILDYVDSQLTLIDNSVPQVESVLKVGNSLRRSLLQAAFTGQLTKEVVSV